MNKSCALFKAALIAAFTMFFSLGSLLSFSPASLDTYHNPIISWIIRLLILSICLSLSAVLINFAYGYVLRQLAFHNDKDAILKLENNWKIDYSRVAANVATAQSGISLVVAASLYVFEVLEPNSAMKMIIIAGSIIIVGVFTAGYIITAYVSIADWTFQDPMRLFEAIDTRDDLESDLAICVKNSTPTFED